MHSLKKILQNSPAINNFLVNIGNILLALFWTIFLYLNITTYFNYHKLTLLLFSLSESIVIVLFIIRTRAKKTSPYSIDWMIAFAGTFLITLYRPTASLDVPIGEFITVIGIILNILGLISLNRSFGIVPAERNIKTKGMYAFVRHPIYASYFITLIGYIIVNQSLYNIVLFVLCISLQLWRINREENLLSKNPEYESYMKKVRFKLIPFVY